MTISPSMHHGFLSNRPLGLALRRRLRDIAAMLAFLEPIGEATPAEAPSVVALWQACGLTRPWNDPHADFAKALEGLTSTILVIRDGKAITGSVMVGFDGHRGWVYYLAVASEHRRHGHGRSLMAAAEAWLRGQGAPKIQLMVRDDNEAAIGFYEALGLERQKVLTLGKFLKD